jgi:DNA polymerase I-like protein with 3'-5' exonuclease and polymerase domains
MLAHYMGDEEFTNVLLRDDIHTRNQTAAGLATRPQAKTFIYAFLYGAGDAKLGSIVGGTAKDGYTLRQRFLRNTPALEALRERVGQASRKGHLTGLDGRKLWVRSEHSALNTLLQAAGAIIMKRALVLLDDYATQHGIDYSFVGNVHDEIQSEVVTEQAEKYGWLAVECIKAAGISFELRCPLDGEYQVGSTWADTH